MYDVLKSNYAHSEIVFFWMSDIQFYFDYPLFYFVILDILDLLYIHI